MNLTEDQKAVVMLYQGSHLVLAPPGTGKTEILTSRIIHALENGILANKMVCLTFTNRAAKEMKNRIAEKIQIGDLFVGNIHAFCVDFLKRNHLITNANMLLDEDERTSLVKEASKLAVLKIAEKIEKEQPKDILPSDGSEELEMFNKFFKDKHLALYNSVKGEFVKSDFNIKVYTIEKYVTYLKYKNIYSFNDTLNSLPESLYRYPPKRDDNLGNLQYSCREEYILLVSKYYEELKAEINGIDYDDLIALTYSFLKENPHVEKYGWLQIDEVQDLNPLQWEIVNLLTSVNAHKIYFGDYEQAIYSFLGAKLENLRSLENECTIHNFSKNFRSPGYLLEVYNAYALALLKPVWKKVPEPDDTRLPDNLSRLVREIDGYEEDELNFIITKIIPNLPADEVKAVLVRKNSSADILGNLLSEYGIAHFKISGFDIFKSSAVKLILAIMQVMLNDLDRSSWIRIFYRFSNFKTLKESRDFISNSFRLGLFPADFIYGDRLHLEDFNMDLTKGRIVVFDTETTGLNTSEDDIIQIAAIEIIEGQIGDTFEVYIDTVRDITESQKIHKISKETLIEKGIDRTEAFQSFLDFVGESPLVAHNLKYDFEICKANFERVGLHFNAVTHFYDSIVITKRFHQDLPLYNLEYLLKKLDVEGVNSHNALDDVKATANLLLKLFNNPDDLFQKRQNFLIENKNSIELFIKKFADFYIGQISLMKVKTKLSHCFNDVAEFIGMELPSDILKIPNYMDHISEADTLEKLLEKHILDFTTFKESDLITGQEKIIISTVHKAKGLGFDNVIITNCNDNTYPHPYSNDIDEDARLFYVALSRAKKRIILTYYTKISKYWYERKSLPTNDGNTRITEIEHEFVTTAHSPFLNAVIPYFRFKKVSV